MPGSAKKAAVSSLVGYARSLNGKDLTPDQVQHNAAVKASELNLFWRTAQAEKLNTEQRAKLMNYIESYMRDARYSPGDDRSTQEMRSAAADLKKNLESDIRERAKQIKGAPK
jgi:hypothetical protein